MKKTLFYLLIIIITLPSIISAEEKEVKYKWYQNVIDKVHYEIDPEQTCEYLEKVDYNDFIYSDVMYSLEKPEEKEERIIKETVKTFNLDRQLINIIKISKFYTKNPLKLYEFELLDENNINIDYTINNSYFEKGTPEMIKDGDFSDYVIVNYLTKLDFTLNAPVDFRKLTFKFTYKDEENEFKSIDMRAFINLYVSANILSNYSEIVDTSCENGKCITYIRANLERINNNPVDITTKIYEYQDKKYKCYSTKRNYLPNYYTDMPGYIKDETDYITLEKGEVITKEEISNLLKNYNDKNNEELYKLNTYLKNRISNLENLINSLNSKDDLNALMNKINALSLKSSKEKISDKIIEVKTSENKESVSEKKVPGLIGMNVESSVPKRNVSKINIFIIIFGLLSLILSFILYLLKVKICRMKK